MAAASPASAVTLTWREIPPELARQLDGSGDLTPSEAASRAMQQLNEAGYYWPDHETRGDTLVVSAGPRGEVRRIHVGLDSSLAIPALSAFREALDGRADPAGIQEALHSMVAVLVSCGRPYSQVRLLALDISSPPYVDIELAVYAGPEVFAGALVTGAHRTEGRVFEREAGWHRGALLESNLIAASEERIGLLPYVATVDTAKLLVVTADTADLYLGVKESPGVSAGGILGWVPKSGANSGFWAGEIELQLRSAFGDGRTIDLAAARPTPRSQRTQVRYWEPWPFGTPLWLGVDLSQEDVEDDFIQTQAGLSARLATSRPRWQFNTAWGRVTAEASPGNDTYPAEYVQVGLGVSDSSQSSSYRFEFDWSAHQLEARDTFPPPQGRMTFTRGRFGTQRWWSLARSAHTQARFSGGGTLLGAGVVPQHLLYREGGIHSLRGYREQEFAVRDFLRASLEGHLGSRRQSVFVFLDFGWLNGESAPSRILGSAGIGLRIEGRLSLLAAVPSEGGLSETKIHIGLASGR
jgi:outer membrane protein assembly factor BamA